MIDFNRITAIYYFHVMNDLILKKIQYIKKRDILNSYLIFADDAHISIAPYMDYIDYVPIIGRCNNMLRLNRNINKDAPDVRYNLQSALYHSLLSNMDGFLCFSSIPKEKRLNHTHYHSKHQKNNNGVKVGMFDITTCCNWWSLNNLEGDKEYIYDNYIPYHLDNSLDMDTRIFDINANKRFIAEENQNIIVAPWNEISDDFIELCRNENIDYIVYSDVYDVKNNKNIGIPRINLE